MDTYCLKKETRQKQHAPIKEFVGALLQPKKLIRSMKTNITIETENRIELIGALVELIRIIASIPTHHFTSSHSSILRDGKDWKYELNFRS
jgi:hypothetical protein